MEEDRDKQPGEQELLSRIVVNPGIFGGKPIIRGRRMTVALLLSFLAQGNSPEEILEEYEWLEEDDIKACLLYVK